MDNNEFVESIRDPKVIYSSFMMSYNKTTVYCFIEGKDWCYYYPIYSSHGVKNISPISCYGKSNVLTVKSLIESKANKEMDNIFFLVDKDYSGDIGNGNLYVTPVYSVENFYASSEMFRHFALTELRYSGGDTISLSDLEKLENVFKSRLNDFIEIMIEINAFCSLAKTTHQLCINKIQVKDIVDIKLDKISLKKNAKDLFTEYLAGHSVTDFFKKFNNVRDEFKSNPICYCRGKFLHQFLVKILELIKNDISSNVPTLVSKKCLFSKQVSEKNFLSDFSQYADKPPCLINFVKLAA